MEDKEIVELYWQRNEQAIQETADKYETYCMKISMNILNDLSDSEENVNDTYLQTWKTIPPHAPERLAAFLGKITRNLALNRYKARFAEKRAAGEFALSLNELDDCIPDGWTMEQKMDSEAITACMNTFLWEQPLEARRMFVYRYFYCESVEEIAVRFGYSKSKVKSKLFRIRNSLRIYLEREGIHL
ncbi:MAG: RNA polymerase sigma factor [Lachnospiraceae bacterium]